MEHVSQLEAQSFIINLPIILSLYLQTRSFAFRSEVACFKSDVGFLVDRMLLNVFFS